MTAVPEPDAGQLVRLHPGVIVEDDQLIDRATGRGLQVAGASADPARIVGLGFGYVPRARPGLVGPGTVLGSSPFRTLRATTMSFRRRLPGRSTWEVLLAVAAASRLPGAVMVAVFVLPALVLGLVFDALPMTMRAGVSALVVFWVSLVLHESAHLMLLRAVERNHTVGAVMHSWANVWIVGPDLSRRRCRAVAATGPLVGIIATALLWWAGLPGFVCVGAALVHSANLLPWAPDGRAVLTGGS